MQFTLHYLTSFYRVIGKQTAKAKEVKIQKREEIYEKNKRSYARHNL